MSTYDDATAAASFAYRPPRTWRDDWIPRAAVAICVAGLVVSEFAVTAVRHYWIQHPLTAGFVASAATLAATVIIVDAVVRSREAKRWEPVAQAAFRELSTDAFAFYLELLELLGLAGEDTRLGRKVPVLPTELYPRLEAALESRSTHPMLSEFLYGHTERLGRSVARWAPVMLQTPQLANAFAAFGTLRDTLISANEGFRAVDADPNWRWGVLTSFDVYFLLVAHFDTLRRDALNEPLVFGKGEADYRAALGLPARETPADLQREA